MEERQRSYYISPAQRLVLFFVLAPTFALGSSLLLDRPIGDGYGQSALGAAIGLLVVSVFLVIVADRRPIGSLGLRFDALMIRDVIIGIIIPTVQLGIIFYIELKMGWVRVRGFDWNGDVLRMAFWRWLGVAWFEELLVRGYLFQCLLTLGGLRLGPLLALSLTSGLFGYLHFTGPHATFALIVIGTEFGVAYLVTRRLWLPIAMHVAWNFVEGTLLGFSVSGRKRPSFLLIDQIGPESWTGGSFGPEASPTAVLLASLDIALMLGLSRLGFWRSGPCPSALEPRRSASPSRADGVGS